MISPFSEHRLIHLNIKDVKDQTRYNARNAELNAAQQTEQRKAQLAAGGTSVAPVAKVAVSQELQNVRNTYNNASDTLTKTADPYDGSAGVVTATAGTPNGSGGGMIEAGARERLTTAGITGEEQDKRITASKSAAAETMSNTGQGVQYSKDGKLIPGSGRLNDGTKDPRLLDIAAISERQTNAGVSETDEQMYKRIAAAQEYNNAINKGNELSTVTGPSEGDGVTGASGAGGLPELPSANIDSFLAGIPAEQREQAAAVFGPLFDYLNKAQGIAGTKMQNGMDALGQIDQFTSDYLKKQQNTNNQMFDYFSRMNQNSLNRKLDSAEATYQADQAVEEMARDRAQSLYERAIRDQMIKNEEAKKSQLLGLGVSGGWRASRQTADVISALSKGDNILSDLYVDAAFSEYQGAANMRKVAATYHSNVAKAYDDYDGANATLFTTMMNRAGEIDKTIYNSSVDKTNAVKGIVDSYLDAYGSIAGDLAKTVSDQNKYAIDLVADQQKAQADKENKTWDQAMKYIDTYGTQNIDQLRNYEATLGLAPGSLSNQKTIEELKMKKASGSGIGSGVTGLKGDIDSKRSMYRSLYPNAGAEEIDNLVYQDIYNMYGNDDKGRKVMRDVYGIMTSSPIDGGGYRIYNTAPGSAATTKVMEDIQNRLDDRDLAATKGPGELYTYLTKGLPEKDRYSDTEAIQYVTDLGYVHVPGLFQPRSTEFYDPNDYLK